MVAGGTWKPGWRIEKRTRFSGNTAGTSDAVSQTLPPLHTHKHTHTNTNTHTRTRTPPSPVMSVFDLCAQVSYGFRPDIMLTPLDSSQKSQARLSTGAFDAGLRTNDPSTGQLMLSCPCQFICVQNNEVFPNTCSLAGMQLCGQVCRLPGIVLMYMLCHSMPDAS